MKGSKIQRLSDALDYLQSLQDGKSHGNVGGCGAPIGKSIFVESWIVPLVRSVRDELLDQEHKRIYRTGVKSIAAKHDCEAYTCSSPARKAFQLGLPYGNKKRWLCAKCFKKLSKA